MSLKKFREQTNFNTQCESHRTYIVEILLRDRIIRVLQELLGVLHHGTRLFNNILSIVYHYVLIVLKMGSC